MRTHLDTHPEFDFAIGYRVPLRTVKRKLCEDCPPGNRHPAQPGKHICLSCARDRDRIATMLLGTLGAPFVP